MASKYLQKFPIPEAFPEILHDYAREVLRDQPEDIIEFSVGYFTALENVGVGGNRRVLNSTTHGRARRSLRRRTVGHLPSVSIELIRLANPDVEDYVQSVFNDAQEYRKTPSRSHMSKASLEEQT